MRPREYDHDEPVNRPLPLVNRPSGEALAIYRRTDLTEKKTKWEISLFCFLRCFCVDHPAGEFFNWNA
jgi:hypothetical protein